MQKRYRFDVTPVSAVRTVQKDAVFFRIPIDELSKAGYNRRIRIERYNKFKYTLLALAKAQRFVPPEQGMHIVFYIPTRKSWTLHEKCKKHLQLHTKRPDVDNLLKAFLDGLLTEDGHVADVRATKRWINEPNGYIEVIISSPDLPSGDVLA